MLISQVPKAFLQLKTDLEGMAKAIIQTHILTRSKLQEKIIRLVDKELAVEDIHGILRDGRYSLPQNAVSTNIKHSRYIPLMSNFLSNHFHTKRSYVHMFCIVDTPFSYGRGLMVC